MPFLLFSDTDSVQATTLSSYSLDMIEASFGMTKAPAVFDRCSHRMVPTEENKLRACTFCSYYKIKTKSGWGVYTRHRCLVCNVPLCKGKRDCFQMFHKLMFDPTISLTKQIETNSGPDTSHTEPPPPPPSSPPQ